MNQAWRCTPTIAALTHEGGRSWRVKPSSVHSKFKASLEYMRLWVKRGREGRRGGKKEKKNENTRKETDMTTLAMTDKQLEVSILQTLGSMSLEYPANCFKRSWDEAGMQTFDVKPVSVFSNCLNFILCGGSICLHVCQKRTSAPLGLESQMMCVLEITLWPSGRVRSRQALYSFLSCYCQCSHAFIFSSVSNLCCPQYQLSKRRSVLAKIILRRQPPCMYPIVLYYQFECSENSKTTQNLRVIYM